MSRVLNERGFLVSTEQDPLLKGTSYLNGIRYTAAMSVGTMPVSLHCKTFRNSAISR